MAPYDVASNIRQALTAATDLAALAADVAAEVAALAAADPEAPATTLIVLPPRAVTLLRAGSFDAFMEGAVAGAEAEATAGA